MKKYIINLIKILRIRTGLGISICQKAILNSNFNIEKAIEYLRKIGKIKAIKKINLLTKEGLILTKVNNEKTIGIIIEFNCETDFVAFNIEFKKFCEYIINIALIKKINILKKINKKIYNLRINLMSKLGENINISKLCILKDTLVANYTHGLYKGVLVTGKCIKESILKKIAMHIILHEPKYIEYNEISNNILKKEYKIQLDYSIKYDKLPIVERYIYNRIFKYFKNQILKEQKYIMDSTKLVKNILNENNILINKFIIYKIK